MRRFARERDRQRNRIQNKNYKNGMSHRRARVTAALFNLARTVLRSFYLFAHRRKKFSDSDLTGAIDDERWNRAASIGVNGIGRARLVRTVGLEQPAPVACLQAHDTLFLRWAELIRRRPSVLIDQAISGGPRLLPNAQCVIAIFANFRREPLGSDDRLGLASDQRAFDRVGHEAWIIFEVVDDGVNGATRRVDAADSLKFLERRASAHAAVNCYVIRFRRELPAIVRVN